MSKLKLAAMYLSIGLLMLTAGSLGHAQDIGAQINSAWSQCGSTGQGCTYQLGSGTFSQTTTIEVPCITDGKISLIGSGAGSILNYSGNGPAIEAACPGTSSLNLTIKDLHVILTSNAPSGIHLRTLNHALIENVVIEGGTNAEALLNEGANAITVINPNFMGNRNGIRNVGILLNGTSYNSNAVKVYGGQITLNSNCGVLEDGSQVASVGAAIGNSYDGVVFEDNGTDNSATSGNACVQEIYGGSFTNDYFEYGCSRHIPYSVWIGDSGHKPNSVVFTGNTFASCGATGTFNLVNSLGVKIDGNIEVTAISTFIQNNSSASATVLGLNLFLAVTNAGNQSPLLPGVSGPTTGIYTTNYTAH